jgi:hypothetical protein
MTQPKHSDATNIGFTYAPCMQFIHNLSVILSAHENLASCARAFLRIAALENLAVE